MDFGEKFILYGLQEYTVEAWFKWSGEDEAQNAYGIYGEGHRSWSTLFLNLRKNGSIEFGDFDSSVNLVRLVKTEPETVSSEAWHHVAAVRSGNSFRLFLDGMRVGEVESKTSELGIVPPRAYIGKGGFGDNGEGRYYFNGAIDEIRLSSQAKYTENFTPVFRFEVDSDTEALWHFNEGSGSIVMDSGNNAHQGTIQENATWSDDGIWRVFDCAPKWQSCEQNSVQVCNEYGRWVEYQTCEGEEICTETGNRAAACE